jgi:hypothetical protein
MKDMRNAYRISVGNPEKKTTSDTYVYTGENFKTDVKEMLC